MRRACQQYFTKWHIQSVSDVNQQQMIWSNKIHFSTIVTVQHVVGQISLLKKSLMALKRRIPGHLLVTEALNRRISTDIFLTLIISISVRF